MATFTENYNLIKPGEEDYYDVQDFNENMDAIDAQLMETEQEMAGVSEKIGVSGDTGSETVFGRLAQLAANTSTTGSAIKSAQYVTYSLSKDATSGTCKLKTVDPKKCFVIMERLCDNSGSLAYLRYTLSATELSLSHISYSTSHTIVFGFWIIEFY